MVNQILNTPHDLEFAGRWLANQFKLSPKKRKEKIVKLGGIKTDPKLAEELKETKKQLNSILTEWKWGDWKPKTAQEFLNKFKPWVSDRLKENKELSEFLKDNKVNNLTEIKENWERKEEYYLKRIDELKNKGSSELSEDLKEKLKNYDDLEIERDEAIRDKKTTEQDLLATNNRLKLKQQEVNNKDEEIKRIKKEFQEKDKALNKTIKELKDKAQKREKLLDEEQTENNKLTEENEKLQEKIKELEKERKELLKNQK